eukprot:TRINITY_DN8628_c0_g1_i1.p1 TRINITY_DN8628_c0_g1~~TRINITY_DN8628_c0_g1_i1.p1  ORF type:complete len:1076 (+),score=188.04 TRINITY_DN8628_c0_g1_i1:27-3230(+)
MENKTHVSIVLGPPGSGKGTQCKTIAKETGMLHLSTGDLCRQLTTQGGTEATQIKHHFTKGEFVEDKLIIDLVMGRLKSEDSRIKGVLLDGFPRTLIQAQELSTSQDIIIDRVIYLSAPDEVCSDRISSRRVDSENGDVYNLKYNPAYDPMVASRLSVRETDHDPKLVTDRLHTFHMNIGNILKYFPGKLLVVDGSKSLYEVENYFRNAMQEVLEAPQNTQVSTTSSNNQNGGSMDPGDCVVCMASPANYLVVPCGHQCGCDKCLETILNADRKCPICRQSMSNIVRVYLSGIQNEPLPPPPSTTNKQPNNTQQSSQFPVHNLDDGGWDEEDQEVAKLAAAKENEISGSEVLKVDIAPCVDMSGVNTSNHTTKNKCDVAITLKVPDLTTRVPIDICCVIDISGSMGEDAKFQDPNDETKTVSEGMNILDIVKHAVKTIIYTLTENDRISLVEFDTIASTVFALDYMTETKRQKAIEALERLQPRDSTNIWAGLSAGLDSLRNVADDNKVDSVPRKKSLVLLTDGQPNAGPLDREDAHLKKYYADHPGFTCQVNTFGFGYSLKTKLMTDLAHTGNGTFAFIPDAKIVGTCFVNAVANASVTLCQKCEVHLTPRNGSTFAGEVAGYIPFERTHWGKTIKLGPLYYGQPRDIVIPMTINSDEYLDVSVTFETDRNFTQASAVGQSTKATPDSIWAYVRNLVVVELSKIIKLCDGNGKQALNDFRALCGRVAGFEAVSSVPTPTGNNEKDPRIVAIYKDLSGRVSKAISTPQRFKRWGNHYLSALLCAHQLQLRTNFMDPGLQCYGGTLFSSLEKAGGRIFVTLPMKKKEDYKQQLYGNAPTVSTYKYVPPPVTTTTTTTTTTDQDAIDYNATYYAGSGGGCFDEKCSVLVRVQVDGEFRDIPKEMSQVKKGDLVKASGYNCYSKVVCVVKIERERQDDQLVEFHDCGLKITKKHPVKINGKWQFPISFVDNKDCSTPASLCASSSKYVYNFVLDQNRVVLVNGVECVTFGHGLLSDPVTHHPFYANENIIKFVSSQPGFSDGLVNCHGSLRQHYFKNSNLDVETLPSVSV